ncbi:unnamed protein product [Arctia plantaginis]|uniref:Uncharacterized protein n=1 Tax=Arctia plantaginis TaxID=874455 RepID=A0A8S1A353_ARCPL|nr:unnamed protein product [Arctia plantaginis]
MECNDYMKNGLCGAKVPAWSGRVGFKFGANGAGSLLVASAAHLSGGSTINILVSTPASYPSDHPFMSTMDEITYWIYTKRAPCLMNYDNVTKKLHEEAHCSKTKPKSVPSKAEVPTPKKKKKRKLSLLEDDSGSAEKLQNVYFDSSQNKKQTLMSSAESDSIGSDIDFNIRTCITKGKQKHTKLKKTNKSPLHKKNKVVTSTPKVSQLRRSLRQAQQTLNNNSQLNSSFQVVKTSFTNGHNENHSVIEHKSHEKTKNSTELLAGGDQSIDNKKNNAINKLNESKNEALNGQFEDLSDVSGFTANYIRSTKLQSTKTPRKLRCKNNRSLVKESKQSGQKDCTMLVCADKSVNTVAQNIVHDCSTESENVINLVTAKSTERTPRGEERTKVSKSTSLLKFLDSRTGKESMSKKKVCGTRTRARTNLNVSFESQTSAPRYPKRHRNNSATQDEEISAEVNLGDKKESTSRNSTDFNNSDKKENPDATTVSKTRSGRSLGLSLRQPENLVLVLSNSTEQVSSMVSMNVGSSMVSLNVANPKPESKERKKKRTSRHLRSKKMNDKRESLQKDSLRDKSGFTACFSDSDDDSEPLKQRKFFCS